MNYLFYGLLTVSLLFGGATIARNHCPFHLCESGSVLDAQHSKDGVVRIVAPNGSYGSGFIVSSDGYVVTAGHVADLFTNGTPMTVQTPQGQSFLGHVIARVPTADAAIVKIDNVAKGQFSYIKLATVDPKVGDVGLGWGWSHARLAEKKMFVIENMYTSKGKSIELTPGVDPGDSGGLLMNQNGEAEGIIVAYIVQNHHSLATSIDEVRNLIPQQR